MNRQEIVNSEKIKLSQKRTNALLKTNNVFNSLLKNKDFYEIEQELRKTTAELSKFEIGTKEEQELRKKYKQIQKKKEQIIEKLGVRLEDLTPKFECPLCNDTGFVNGNICKCLQKNVQQRLKQESGLANNKLHSFKESNNEIVSQNETLTKAYKIAQQFVNTFPNNNPKNLVFVGNVGKGKTFLAECIANEIMQKNFYVVYVTTFELNNLVIKTMDLFADNRDELLSPLLECDLLIIDDLGTEPVYKKFSIDNLYTIINQRQLKNLSTIISTNLTPQMIRDNYGDRLFSRIFNKQNTLPILFEGKDLRINK